MLVVMKFGGTSVGSVAALQQVISINKKARDQGDEVVIVVSAMSGVTDLLLSSARKAEAGDVTTAYRVHQEILAKHTHVIDTLLANSQWHDPVLAEISALLDEFDSLCRSINVLGELTPRALDVIAGMGERMNVRQVAAVLERHDVPAQAIDATRLIVTDARYGAASPLMPPTAERSQALLGPLIRDGIIPVVTGFIGATEAGIPTTLGRGGSDYSATILGRALGADEVWIWTDVNGVMTADPRIVPDACTVPYLSYAEVGEMAYFGAKVLHPQAIRPAKRSAIPVRILNTFQPDHPGTLITKDPDGSNQTVKAITSIKGLSLITVEGAGMIGVPGVAARTFGAVARSGTSVLMISQSSSEQSICFVVPTGEVEQVLTALQEEMAHELERRDIERIWPQDDIVILAVVGAGMKGTPGIASRVFGALGTHRINVIAIAQGSSEYNISLVIARGDADDAVRRIHEEFRLGAARPGFAARAGRG
jgi:aspartokinase/homoserine dehydrogenase 1